MGLLTKIQSRLELRRLEKKYTTRRKVTPPSRQAAQYIDGEYIYETPKPPLPPFSFFHLSEYRNSHPTSSSSIYAEQQQQQQQQYPPVSPTAISFTTTTSPEPAPVSSHLCPGTPNPSTNSSSSSSAASKHTSLTSRHSLTPSFLSTTNPKSPRRTSTTSATEGEKADLSRMLSRNSRGQSWQPPRVGWGTDGTDAWRCEYEGEKRREFRFDVEADRRSMIIENAS